MTNGRAWTPEEDEQLRRVIYSRGSTLMLADDLGRTHGAVLARSSRLGIPILAAHDACPLERLSGEEAGSSNAIA